MLSKFPEPAEIHKSVNGRCILDGEIVVLAGGILDEGAVWVNPDYVCVIEYMPNLSVKKDYPNRDKRK